jgi:hypothetical protein
MDRRSHIRPGYPPLPGPLPGLLLLAALACGPALGTGCEERHSLLRRKSGCNDAGECITRVRGIKGHLHRSALSAAPRPTGGGPTARLLIQPLGERLTRGRTIWALYVNDSKLVHKVRSQILTARPAPYRSCKPGWRIDVRYGSHEHVARVNLPCRRLEVDGKNRAFEGPVAETLEPLLRRALRRPDHKILRIRVAVEHDPQLILQALAPKTIEAYLPRKPAPRGPLVRMTHSVLRRAPSDPTQLDAAIAALRTSAYQKLRGYSRQIRVSRHEVIGVWGPDPIQERFNDKLLEAKYGVTVLFKHKTPDYMLGFLGLGNDLAVESVKRPEHYRVDAVFPSETRLSQMRKILRKVPVKPRLRRW